MLLLQLPVAQLDLGFVGLLFWFGVLDAAYTAILSANLVDSNILIKCAQVLHVIPDSLDKEVVRLLLRLVDKLSLIGELVDFGQDFDFVLLQPDRFPPQFVVPGVYVLVGSVAVA